MFFDVQEIANVKVISVCPMQEFGLIILCSKSILINFEGVEIKNDVIMLLRQTLPAC